MSPAFQRQIIFWTSMLVIGLGAVIWLVILQPPAFDKDLTKSQRFVRKMARLAKQQDLRRPSDDVSTAENRTPASFKMSPTLTFVNTNDFSALRAVDLELPCRDVSEKRMPHNVSQVRLSGNACSSGLPEIESAEIRNDTNGFSATVFLTGRSAFMTDYISIAPGRNRVRILHRLKTGAREERDFTIEREAKPAIN